MPILARGNPARWWNSRSCGGPSRAPRGLFISPFRRWASRLALAFLLLFIAGFWYLTNPARVSRLSEALLSRVLGGTVTVRSAHLSLSGTLILSGIEVRTDDPSPAGAVPIFTAEQIEARFDWFSLLSGQLSATQLVATTPVFQPIEDRQTGQWNYERLRPGFSSGTPGSGPSKGLALPVVILRDAHVKWGEVDQGRVRQTSETIINGNMTPDPALASTYHFQFSPGGAGAMLRGTWDSARNTFNISTDNVVMSDNLRNSLPGLARDWCAEHHLAGRLSKLNLAFTPRDGLTLTVTFDEVSMIWMIDPEQGIAVGDQRPSYPLDLRNIHGQVVFSLKQNIMRLIDLRGKILGYDFVANCEIQGTTRDAPYNLDLRFPNATVDRYPPLFMAFLSSQDLIQRLEPHGNMDIFVNLRRDTPGGPVLPSGRVDFHDARLRYAHFPAPLDHVNGSLTFDHRSITFHDVTGMADQGFPVDPADPVDVHINGTCGSVWTNRYVDVTVTSPHILLDDRLAACLPAEYQEVWNLFALRGRGSFTCRITRADTVLDRQKIVVDVDLADAHGYLRAVPYEFSQAACRLHIQAGETRIEHLTARTGADGSGRVSLDGVVRQVGDDAIHLQPELHIVADVPIDPELLHAFPDTLTSKLAGITVGGRLGFDGTVRRTGNSGVETVQVAGNINWKQGVLQTRFGEQPLSFSAIDAQAVLSPTSLDLKNLTADLDAGAQKLQLQLAGKLDPNTAAGLMRLTLAGKNLPLPADAPPIFPQSWRDTWHAYAPAGIIDLNAEAALRLNLPANPDAKEPPLRLSDNLALDSYTVRLALHDASLKESSWPDTLAAINGKLEFVPATVSMTGMTATIGNVSLAWSGQTDPATGKISLSGDASSKSLPTQWLNHLPDALASNLDQKRENVSLALHLDSLTRAAADKPWELQGKLHTANLASAGALPLILEQADFTGKALYTPAVTAPPRRTPSPWFALAHPPAAATFDFTGALAVTNLTVSNRLIESLTATLSAAGERHEISIAELDGKVAGGTLQGTIRIQTSGPLSTDQPATTSRPLSDSPPATSPRPPVAASSRPVEDGGFIAELVLNDAQLSRLVLSDQATDEERKTIGTGRVTASLSLRQTFGAQADRTGRGDLIVRDGDIYNVPLSMGLMQVATLRLPVARSFQQASMSYFLRNDRITFERILLESPGINLAGLGTVSLATRELNMSFITQTPNEFWIPGLSDLLGGLRNQLLELSVTGTLDTPKITPVPLSAISRLLRALLP